MTSRRTEGIQERVNYLSALIEYDLKKRGEISPYIKGLILDDLKLTQDEWDNLEETHKFAITRATQRFRELLNDSSKKD